MRGPRSPIPRPCGPDALGLASSQLLDALATVGARRQDPVDPLVRAARPWFVEHGEPGFAHALRKRRAEGKPITGQWKRAELFSQDFQSYCYKLQNRDGSMSTDWFEGREDNGDLDRKIQTTQRVELRCTRWLR